MYDYGCDNFKMYDYGSEATLQEQQQVTDFAANGAAAPPDANVPPEMADIAGQHGIMEDASNVAGKQGLWFVDNTAALMSSIVALLRSTVFARVYEVNTAVSISADNKRL